ncbi:MAG: zinc ribbon domain-containing protein [Candidatus Bathyarchaeota archaeon]|nr:zinc ribbon domain-containing protein [Candidatus Termiticorpusculum sp.]
MPLEDYLMPNESIKYQSECNVRYGEKEYSVILTDIRLILYAIRGMFFKSDDVVTELLTNIRGIKYKETGILTKTAHLQVNCIETQKANAGSIIDLMGSQYAIKALYQRLLPFLAVESKQTMSSTYMSYSRQYPVEASQDEGVQSKFCSGCGMELSQNSKFCNNCGKPQ